MKKMVILACALLVGSFVVSAYSAGSCCPSSKKKAAAAGETCPAGEQAEGEAKCGAKAK
jgi:hypothetical protein